MKHFKTYNQKTADIQREWFIVDASVMPLGRLATLIADKLIGKSKVTFTSHVDNGDYVVVVNARNLQVSGDKITTKMYYRHSGYIGNLKELTLQQMLEKDPTEVIRQAVKGMLPKNKLAPDRLARLRVFADAEHEHTAQTPKPLIKETK
jgi:large subunit ribosomal protein L13